MSLSDITDPDRLKRINNALVNRVELAMDQQRNAFSLFQTAISLEGQVRRRTDELTATLRSLEEANAELARQKEISERADQSKTRFLAAASHDILQPLNAAQLTISSLHDLQVNDLGRTMVRQVERSLDTMNELLRTLLDISRLDAGVTMPSFTSVPITPVVDSLLSDLRPVAERKGLKLRTAITQDYVHTDRVMLRRALQNLISNAIRYTDHGGVLIGTRRRGDFVSIEVVDTGCGIPADQLEVVFEEFHRGTHGKLDTDDECALGLGLAIVRRLVTALRHELSVTSKLGGGSTFRILAKRAKAQPVPIRPDPRAAPQPGRDACLAGKRLLVIENDGAVLDAMSMLLESWGCEYRLATSQSRAFEALSGMTWIPDVIIADQHLDHGDLGTSTLRALAEVLPDPVPAILATADASPEVVERAAQLHAEYMPKPLRPAQLRALISHLLSGQASSNTG
ncbi:MAG: response regulator [Roseibium sp.]|nr:response regulator [Roseibium sp.]